MSELQTQHRFDYGELDVETREFVRGKETAIKARTAQTIIDNGRDLMEAKERLKHGQFQKWIEANFPWSPTTARKMMKAAETFKTTDSVVLKSFQREAMFLLSATSTPAPARTEALDRAEAGEKITHKMAQEIKAAHLAKEQAEAEKAAAEEAAEEARQEAKKIVSGYQKQIESLNKQIHDFSDPESESNKANREKILKLEAEIYEIESNSRVIYREKIPDDYHETQLKAFEAELKASKIEEELERVRKQAGRDSEEFQKKMALKEAEAETYGGKKIEMRLANLVNEAFRKIEEARIIFSGHQETRSFSLVARQLKVLKEETDALSADINTIGLEVINEKNIAKRDTGECLAGVTTKRKSP